MADLGQELIREAAAGNKEGVGTLLEMGAPLDAVDYTGGTALMSSASNGHLDVVKLLAAKGANLDRQKPYGFTALLLAAIYAHLPVCLFLISLGADPTAQDMMKRTALTCWKGPSAVSAVTALKEARHAYLVTKLHRPSQATSVLLFSDAFSDLVFVCPGRERIHAHRNIVAACSPHVKALLQGPWAENAGGQVSEVKMPQSAESVRALLRFMYTGEVDATACISHPMDILDLASQHEQPELKAACATLICETIHLTSFLPILEIALLHDIKELKAKCIAFVQNNVNPLSLPKAVTFANKHNIPELKAACERGVVAVLTFGNLVPYLEAALCLDLPVLEKGCIAYAQKHKHLIVSKAFVKLANANPKIWDDLRAALGVRG